MNLLALFPRRAGALPRVRWSSPLLLLLGLLLAALAVRAVQVIRTEVISRDGIAFVEFAQELTARPWGEVLQSATRHPGYPVLVWAAAKPITALLGPTPAAWQLAAQLVSATCGVMLTVPLFLLGREMFGRRTAALTCLLFLALPANRVVTDALSEGPFLLAAVTGLWLAARAFRHDSARLFLLSGTCSGLAYLIRPEGAVVTAASVTVMLARQFSPACRPWERVVVGGLAVVAGAALTGGPLIAATGKLTMKPSANVVIDQTLTGTTSVDVPGDLEHPAVAGLFAVTQEGAATHRKLWAASAVIEQVIEGLFFWAGLPAVAGLCLVRLGRANREAAAVVLFAAAVIAGLLWKVAAALGYVSERHLILVLLAATFWTAAGIRETVRWLKPWPMLRLGCVATVAILSVAGLSRGLTTLHPERAGHRSAGEWLAAHAKPNAVIYDPHMWAAFYAGRPSTPTGDGPVYVVLDQAARLNPKLPLAATTTALIAGREPIHVVSGRAGRRAYEVAIYEIP